MSPFPSFSSQALLGSGLGEFRAKGRGQSVSHCLGSDLSHPPSAVLPILPALQLAVTVSTGASAWWPHPETWLLSPGRPYPAPSPGFTPAISSSLLPAPNGPALLSRSAWDALSPLSPGTGKSTPSFCQPRGFLLSQVSPDSSSPVRPPCPRL